MANVLIHGRSPDDAQLSLRCDDTGVLLTSTAIAGENGQVLIVNQTPLTEPNGVAGSINTVSYGFDTVRDAFGVLAINDTNQLIIANNDLVNIRATTDKMKFTGQNLKVVEENSLAIKNAVDAVNTTLQNGIDVNVDSITIGDVTFEASDTITHEKLDTVNTNITSTNTKLDTINTTISNKTLDKTTSSIDISGQSVNVNTITGFSLDTTSQATNTKLDTLNTTLTNKTLSKLTSSIDISGQSVNVNTITGFSLDTTTQATNTKLDTLNTTLTNKTLDKTTSSIDISGQSVNVNTITGFSLDTTTQATNTKLDTLNTTISNKTLDKTTSSIDISGQSVNVNTISGFSLDTTTQITNTKLDTINTTINNKHLNNTTDSVSVSGSVNVSNTIIDVNIGSISDAPYDLLLNGATLWADSTPTPNPFFADLNGREGWYYDNLSNVANLSNVYWYANPVSGNLQETDMTFLEMTSMYCIITCDYVENGSLTIPTMAIFTQPTGVDDIIPGFAHSRWVYQLNATNRAKLRKNETIILYTGSTRPNVYLTLPAYQMNIASVNIGANVNEVIAYLSINTQATTSKIGYLLQYAGFLNSTLGFNREYQFLNSKDRVIQNNQYSNTVDVDGLTFNSGNLNVNVASGSISVSSVNIKDSSGDNLESTSGALNSFITNSSIDTHCYASSNGTTWHHLSSDANGQLNIHSKTQDGAGTDITSTLNGAKRSLDVNVSNTVPISGSISVSNTVPISGSVSVGAISNGTTTIQAGIASKVFQDCMSNIKGVNPTGGANNEMVSTGRPDLNKTGNTANSFSIALDTNSFLNGYNPSTGNIKMLTMDESVGSKRALDVNVVNSSSNTVQITNGTINASINPTISNLASANGLVVDSVNYGLNISAGTISPITTIINGSKNQMETRDNDAVAELTTIDNKIVQGYNTTNDGGVIGLNTYSIYPKYKYYSMRGRSTVADANMIFGAVGNSRYFYSDAFGIANVKTWWAYSESVARTITYEYVDASGNQGVGTRVLPATTWTQLTLQNGSVGSFLINKWSQSINPSSATNVLYIAHTTNNGAYNAFGGYFQDNYNSLFTVPNGYVACITNVMFYSNAGDDYLLMLRWSASGIRDIAYYWTNAKYFNQNYAGQYGGVGVVFTAGETIGFATLNTASYKDFSATVQLMPV